MFKRFRQKCLWRRAHELKLIIRQGALELADQACTPGNDKDPMHKSKMEAINERIAHLHGHDVAASCCRHALDVIDEIHELQSHPWNSVFGSPTDK